MVSCTEVLFLFRNAILKRRILSVMNVGEMPQAVACLDAISRSVTTRRMRQRDDDASSDNSSASSSAAGRGYASGREVDVSLDFQSATLEAMKGENTTRQMLVLLGMETQDMKLALGAMFVSTDKQTHAPLKYKFLCRSC
jgi:hypothetical protein